MFTITAGGALRWYRDTVGIPEKDEAHNQQKDPYDVICAHAASSPAGANGLIFMPTMSGAVMDPHARGVWAGLTLAHTRDDMARSVLEGILFELKDILESFKEAEFDLKTIRITGGGAKSDFWGSMQADIFGVPVLRPIISDGPLLGCVYLAGFGTGIFKSLHDFADTAVKIDKTFNPDMVEREKYESCFSVYRKLMATLSAGDVFKEMDPRFQRRKADK